MLRLGTPRQVLGTALLSAGVLAASGCEEPDPDPSVVISDSLGIRIIDVAWDEVPVGPQLAPEPEWVLGDESVLPLFEVEDARELADGSIVIANGGSQEVLWLERVGAEPRRFGGSGEGPEEFRGLTAVVPDGVGRVWAFDDDRHRMLLLDRTDGVVDARSVADVARRGGSSLLLRSLDGEMYVANVAGAPSEWTEGWSRTEAPIVRLGPDPDTVRFVPGREFVMLSSPLGYGAVGPGATALAVGAEDGIWVSDTRNPSVELWSDAVGPEVIIRWRSQVDEVRSRRRSLADARLAESIDPTTLGGQLAAAMWEAVPETEPLPALHGLLSGPDGAVWIGRDEPIEARLLDETRPAQEWLLVDPEGPEVSAVATPRGFLPTQVGEGFVLGVSIDSLGVEVVEKYSLESLNP